MYRELQGCTGIGRVMYFGTYRDCNVMVMELLGPSLEDLFNKCGRRFSLKTTLQLADQLLERAETLHENHLIHRDIKPANFVTTPGEHSMVFCIDFGLSKRYRHPHTLQHIPYREGRSLTGTPRYASVANHQGIETSRRDDLESIGYILVYFLLGKLPWQGLKVPPNVAGTASQKHRLILDRKQTTPLPELCRGCPVEFQEFIQFGRRAGRDFVSSDRSRGRRGNDPRPRRRRDSADYPRRTPRLRLRGRSAAAASRPRFGLGERGRDASPRNIRGRGRDSSEKDPRARPRLVSAEHPRPRRDSSRRKIRAAAASAAGRVVAAGTAASSSSTRSPT